MATALPFLDVHDLGLTRAGPGLHSMEPIGLVARSANDRGAGDQFAYLVNHPASRLVNR